MNQDNDYCGVSEATRLLGYQAVNVVYSLLRSGALAGQKVDGVWRIERAGVEARLARRHEKAAQKAKCQQCGATEGLRWTPDPYRSPTDDERPYWLCADCAQDNGSDGAA